MKNRSHRLPTPDPPDDWVDGSWTVDCVCGVNFDDGEEMVDCDECGVWVHTRCSRYVKSEKSFACDKCKNRNARNDSEETEVAQLLVELPTKTLRMDSPYASSGPPCRPFRLWTDIPIEERVHVQGIPGGEPAIFGGLSAIFTPDLWKCTGYVPKRFNFQYREFPCWDEKPGANTKLEEENENPVDKGAGVLFSLSKENALFGPPATSVSVRRQVDESGQESLVPPKDAKKWECENIDASCGQESVAKDAVLSRPVVSHSSKRKQEDSVAAKDARKKGKVVEREKESKKRAPQAPKTACTVSSDAKQMEFYEDRGSRSVKTDTHLDPRSSLLRDPSLGGHHMLENNVNKPKDDLALNEHHSTALASDACGQNISVGARLLEGKDDHQVSTRTENSGTDNGMALSMECNHPGSVPIKEEDVGLAPDTLTTDLGGPSVNAGIDPHKSDPNIEDSSAAVVNDKQSCQDPSVYPCENSVEACARVKTEADLDKSQGTHSDKSSAPSDIKLNGTKPVASQPGVSTDHLSSNVKMNDTTVVSLQSSDPKVQGVDRSAEAVTVCQMDTASISPYDPNQNKQQSEELEGSAAVRKSSSELKHDLRASEQPSKYSRIVVSPTAATSERKLVTSVGKISSASSDNFISKPSASNNCKPSNVQSSNPTKKWGTPDGNINIKKVNNLNDVVRREEKHELPRKVLKDRSKSAVSSVLKVSHSSKTSHASDPKRKASDSKHPVLHSSSKASSTQNVGVTSGCGESAGSLQSQSASHVQNKISGSGLPQKGEKVIQPNSQLSTKVNHAVPMHHPAPSNGPATLSDEELALLLHQELNSSPRVPRVPRLRHTGSLPQIASPTATSILIKRTSSSGGSNHSTVARRKNKDSAKDGSRSSREVDDEAKMAKLPPSPDQKRHDSACTLDTFTKRESDSGSGKGLHTIKKSVPSASTATVSGGLSSSTEANEQNMSSMCNSLRNASDDDTGAIGVSTPRTLPGLIAEIMSKGKHMSYEELCNAVLPHWPNLRKHNGERYAYSSHSQAVLDCLRNRHEWAQLVDRGPKTGASRKRRKPDAESPTFEPEDNVYGKDAILKDVESKSFESHREEFPKGKRKARKRRRLALQGRGIKDVRRRRKADELSDEDVGSFFSSSEESMFSEEEIQGGEATLDGSEASSSADEMGAS